MNENKQNNKTTNQATDKNTLDGVSEERTAQIRQNSRYNKKDRPAPDNSMFWEDESNPLSSKGN